MTTPVKAQRNRYLAKVVDELPGHRAALDVAAQAQQMLEEMRAPRPVPESNHPLRTGIVTDEWIDASLAHTAA
ncbi:MAG: hypothetical protein ACRET2_17690, partial [Steroidobacteraceae bacterium]